MSAEARVSFILLFSIASIGGVTDEYGEWGSAGGRTHAGGGARHVVTPTTAAAAAAALLGRRHIRNAHPRRTIRPIQHTR